MKKDIHPRLHPVIFVDSATGDEVVTSSTMTSNDIREVDGIQYYVLRADVTSYSHPFYTGTERVTRNVGRVERFNRKYRRGGKKKS